MKLEDQIQTVIEAFLTAAVCAIVIFIFAMVLEATRSTWQDALRTAQQFLFG